MDFRILFARTITTSILLLFITISTSYAEQAATSSGGTSASVGTDPNTGAASVSVPIEVPPGRNGMAPNLALTYNSNKRNGWLGVGWDMKTSFIQRNTKWGLDYSDNDYVADGNRELVERGDWGAYSYGQKTEGAFIKYYYNGSGGWVATTKNGTKHYYGTTATSRQDDPNDSSRVFKWMIDRVEDTNGNYITYTYTKDQGEIYLDKIDYTGGNGLSPTNYVKFYYDDSRTDVSLMYTSNFQVKVSKRLITIEAVSNGSMVRAYKLEYDADPQTSGLQYSASTSRSILYSVQQYGMDATLDTYGVVTGGTYIPAMEMMWQDDVNETFGPRIADAGGVNFVGYTRAMSDVNGDGKSDIIYINETDFSVYLSQGDGTFGPRIADAGGVDFVGYTRAMSDVNGDGKSDIIYINETDFSVYLSQGDGTFGPRIADAGGVNFVSYTRAMSDVNGDGKSDIIYINETDFSVYLSQGDGTFGPRIADAGGVNFVSYTRAMADVNGDGKSDIIYINETDFSVYLSQGNGTFGPRISDAGGVNFDSYTRAMADVNGDGKSDIIYINETDFSVFLSQGDGTFGPRISDAGGVNFVSYTRVMADVNGDGKSDIVYINETDFSSYLSDDAATDLLDILTNGVGGKTTITYEPSSTYDNNVLPFVIQTVSSISVDDGNGNTYTTDYTYSGGHHDIADRDFRGFEYVMVTDPAGTTSETWFKQGDIFKGLPYKTEVKDSSGNLYSRSEKTFSTTSPYTGVDFPFLTQSDDYIYDGTGTADNIRTTFNYDDYGNITEKHLDGNITISGDERDEYTEYDYDTTGWIVSLPNHTYVNNAIGTKVSEAWFAYDANGNLLTDTRWNDSGTNPIITYTYNTNGNQKTITDPNNNTTTITYDPTNTYPYQATNPLSHTATTVYDPGLGKIVSETDPNGGVTTYDYDVFGRLLKVTGPLDTASTYGTVSYEYQECGTANLRIITYRTEEHGTSNHLRSEVCLDGLERAHKTWRDGPDGKTIFQESEFDSSGRVSRKTLPYFTNGTKQWITYTYDPVGRVIQVTNPDSTFTTTSYNRGTTTFIDANGQKKVEVKDVYGRLIKVEEYMYAALYATTTYEYNTIGNLLKLTDDHGNQTKMTYDTLGRKLTMDDPDMGVWSYSYDANGNLASQTDSNDKTVSFTYDALNRLTLKDNPNDPDITYAYDEIFSTNPKGRLTTMTDASGVTIYYYDELGRTVKTTKSVDATDYTTETTYDALGRTKSLTYPDGETVNYTYDTGGNLTTVTDGTTAYAAYSGYNALGQTGGITYGNGATTLYTYETYTNRLSSIVTETSTGADLLNLSYDYDDTDNITTLTDNLDSAHTQSFTYDGLDRLTDAYSDSYGLLSYAYDSIGNISSKRGVSYTYGGPRPHAVTETDGGANALDRAFEYNDINKPSSIDYDGEVTDFVYSGVWSSHNRAEKITSGTTAARTVYIGGIYEQTGSSSTKYIFAGGTRVAVKTDTETYYYHQDHLGSTRVVTNSGGANVEEIHYYPYGETLSDTGSVSVKHKYTSQELDSETGLYNYGARCYDPVLGRFTTADTIVPDPTNPQALNRYSYVLNNPLKYSDPTGHGWFSRIWKQVKRIVKKTAKIAQRQAPKIAGVAAGVATGNFAIGHAVYSGTKAGIEAEHNGDSVLRSILKGGRTAVETYNSTSSGYGGILRDKVPSLMNVFSGNGSRFNIASGDSLLKGLSWLKTLSLDFGFTGGKGKATINAGIKIGFTGAYLYYGLGYGGGFGLSATISTETPSSGIGVIGVARAGTGTLGGYGSVGIGEGGEIKPNLGAGLGYGFGWSVGASHTFGYSFKNGWDWGLQSRSLKPSPELTVSH